MTGRVRLETSLARNRFSRGEPIPLGIVIQNLDDSRPLAVPVPFAPSRPEIRFELQGSRSASPVALGGAKTHDGHSVQVPPGDFYMTEASLTDWHAFDAGAYTIEVRWTAGATETIAEPVHFEVVEPDAMTLAVVDGSNAEPPFSLQTVATVSGPGLGVLLERRFHVKVDDETSYEPIGDTIRFVTDYSLGEAIPVLAAANSNAWIACSTGDGLLTRPGYEVNGAAEIQWNRQRVDVIAPAVETAEGELLIYSLRGNHAVRTLVETRFAAPVTEVEEPEDADDWDDEYLVPGPVNETTLGELVIGHATSTLVRAADNDIRVFALSATDDGCDLHHVRVHAGKATALAAAKLSGVPLPHARPAAFLDRGGEIVAAVALARAVPQALKTLTVGVALVRFADSRPPEIHQLWLGDLTASPKSAAVEFSCIETERPFFRCVVVCDDGVVFAGDRTGQWGAFPPAANLLVPLRLTTSIDRAHVGVRAPNGPVLKRAIPTGAS